MWFGVRCSGWVRFECGVFQFPISYNINDKSTEIIIELKQPTEEVRDLELVHGEREDKTISILGLNQGWEHPNAKKKNVSKLTTTFNNTILSCQDWGWSLEELNRKRLKKQH